MNANVCTECGGAGVVNTWRDRAMATCPTCDGTGQRQRGDRSGDRAALEAEKGLATERVEADVFLVQLVHVRVAHLAFKGTQGGYIPSKCVLSESLVKLPMFEVFVDCGVKCDAWHDPS